MRDLGPLGHCLVEEEGATLRSTQRQRDSLLISVFLQAAVLGALLLIPLLVNGERLRVTLLAPGIPINGFRATDPKPQNTNERPGPRKPYGITKIVCNIKVPENARLAGRVTADRVGVPDVGPFTPGNAEDGTHSLGPLLPGERKYIPPRPPDPAPKEKPVKVSEGVQAARLIHRVMPEYPYIAKHAGVQGEVKLRALIGRDGTVSEVVLLSGHPLLERAAREAVQQWRYQPTLLNGQPVEVETQITVVFILNR